MPKVELDLDGNARFFVTPAQRRRIRTLKFGSMKFLFTVQRVNVSRGDETKPIIRRRHAVQAYYGSARSDGSRLPFLLEPPAAAKVLASMVSSRDSVAALGGWQPGLELVTLVHHMRQFDFITCICRGA